MMRTFACLISIGLPFKFGLNILVGKLYIFKKIPFYDEPATQKSGTTFHHLFPGVVCLIFLFGMAGLIILDQATPPRVVPATAADTEFSAERARVHLREITREVHPVGSEALGRVRDYLVSEFQGIGLNPQVQSMTATNHFHGYRASEVHNIIVKIPGSDPTGGIALMTHYDSSPNSHGASDAGNGVAAFTSLRFPEPM